MYKKYKHERVDSPLALLLETVKALVLVGRVPMTAMVAMIIFMMLMIERL
jgi:hypothetical protein